IKSYHCQLSGRRDWRSASTGGIYPIKPILLMFKSLLLSILVYCLSIFQTVAQGVPSPLQVIGIDFDNNKDNTPADWNNISSKGAGSTIADLQNGQGQPTGYSMEIVAAF